MSEQTKKQLYYNKDGDLVSNGGTRYDIVDEKREEQMQTPEVNASKMAQMLFNVNEVVDKKDRYACQSIFKRYDLIDDKGDRLNKYKTTDGLAISQQLMMSKEETKKNIGDCFKEMDNITDSAEKKEFKIKLAQNIMFAIGSYYSSLLTQFNGGCCQLKAVRHHFRDEKSDRFIKVLEDATKDIGKRKCYNFFEPTGRGGFLTAPIDFKDEKDQPYDDVKLNDVYSVYNSAYTNLANALLTTINSNEDKSLKDDVSSMLEAAASAYNLKNSKDNNLNQTQVWWKNALNYSGRVAAMCYKITNCCCNCCCNGCGKGNCTQGFNNMRRGGSRLIGKGVNKLGFMRWAVKDYKSTKEKYFNVVCKPLCQGQLEIKNGCANTFKKCKDKFSCCHK